MLYFYPFNKKDMPKINPAKVQDILGGIDYPVSKERLIDYADQQGADNDVLTALNGIPEKEYSAPTDVTHEIGLLA